jgi:hypothetical protein
MGKAIRMVFLCFLSTQLWAQSSYQFGLLPALNVNQKLSKNWGLNYKAESRISGAEGRFSEIANTDVQYLLTDVSVLASRKVGLNNTIAAGYLTRLEKNSVSHRTIQQYTLVTRYNAFRLAQRFSSDQTFSKEEAAELRLRYRLSFDVPLNGLVVDDREFYLKINNEYLHSLQGGTYGLEIRVVPSLGYAFNDKNKVELGLDYRLSDFLKGPSTHTFWLPISWYISI